MKAKLVIVVAAMLVAMNCFSQDVIVFRNGTEVKAKVVEITSTEVKFKRADHADGPLYTVLKTDIFAIKYENGAKEVFSSEPTGEPIISSDSEDPEELGYTRLRYNGPKVGFTALGPGYARDWLSARGYGSVITQFGWQFETRLFTLPNNTTGLLEWVLLVGGVEKGLFLPSATMLIGIRDGKQGLEFGLGPNLSATGMGMAFAIGGSFKSGKMYFPINIAVVPSVRKRSTEYDYYGNVTRTSRNTGLRVSLLVGFNTRVR